MNIADFMKRVFHKSDTNKSSSLLERINSSMDLLVQKSQNFNSKYEQNRNEIEEIAKEAKNIKPSKKIFSAKLEQAILGNITAVSSACDELLSGNEKQSIKEKIDSLKIVISQRAAL